MADESSPFFDVCSECDGTGTRRLRSGGELPCSMCWGYYRTLNKRGQEVAEVIDFVTHKRAEHEKRATAAYCKEAMRDT